MYAEGLEKEESCQELMLPCTQASLLQIYRQKSTEPEQMHELLMSLCGEKSV